MKIVKLGKNVTAVPRIGIVYDTVEEFRKHEGEESYLWDRRKMHDERDTVIIGHFLQYDDGCVSKILLVRHYQEFTLVRTICNTLSTLKSKYTKVPILSTKLTGGRWAVDEREDPLTDIDSKKRRFVELWLFNGLSLEDALKATMMEQLKLFHRKKKPTTGTSTDRLLTFPETVREYIRKVLNGPWFDKLLAEDRIVRDRYMSFVGAMESVGLTKEKIAEVVKSALDSPSEKERINALNRVLDIMQIEEAKRGPRSGAINATYRDVDEEAKHLDTQPVKSLPPPQPTEVPINASPKEVNQSSREVLSSEEATENLRGEVRVAEGENGRESRPKANHHSYEEALLEITEEEIRNVETGK